ncbi:MAG: CCA tRNA nucleotidyltransferase [bacterium]
MKRITEADKLIEMLEAAGYEAYYVGGCVRDFLRAEAGHFDAKATALPADIDVTTSATPDEMKEVFAGLRYFETGIKHGTLTVLTPDDERRPVEITTFRTDGDYSDNRHPDEVKFVRNLEEDLARRDFTINAMAMDRRGEIIDIYEGQTDLQVGLIRAVGDPDKRFQEDALRILRALRFAAMLGKHEEPFTIEAETEAAMFRNKELLQNISAERIYAELKKLITGAYAGIVIRRYVDIIGVFIPELLPMKEFEQHNPYHKYDVLEHCVRAMEEAKGAGCLEDYQVKLAALLHDVAKPQKFFLDENGVGHMYGHAEAGEKMVRDILNRLKADNETKDRVCALIRHHDLVFQEDRKLLKRWMNRYTPEMLLEILHIKRADNLATGNMSEELAEKFDRIEEEIRTILEEEQPFSLKDLSVDGSDLMVIAKDLGDERWQTGGPWIGALLLALLDEVIEGTLPNEKEALTARAAELLKNAE